MVSPIILELIISKIDFNFNNIVFAEVLEGLGFISTYFYISSFFSIYI